MPLPQQVVEQLRKDPGLTQGWALGVLFFSGGLFALTIAIYVGMRFVYEPILSSQISNEQSQLSAASAAISVDDQAKLVDFYSQLSNLNTALSNHVFVSKFLGWLESNTEANVYYTSLDLSQGDTVSIHGTARTEADVNQQLAIFENSPQVQSVNLSSVNAAQSGQGYEFDISLAIAPSVFSNQP